MGRSILKKHVLFFFSSYLWWQTFGLKDSSAMHVSTDTFIDFTFRSDQMTLIGRIVERIGRQANDTCFRDNVQAKFTIDNTSTTFRQITLIRNKTTTSETTGTEIFLKPENEKSRRSLLRAHNNNNNKPFSPFGVETPVGLFIFRFEYTDGFLFKKGLTI